MKYNLEQKDWGPSAWSFIHYVALGYPDNPTENDKDNYKNFYYSLQYTLPCPKCAKNYQRHLKDIPIEEALGNSSELFKWTIDIHNEVNKELGKRKYSYQEVSDKYIKKEENTDKTFICLAIILLLIFIGIFLVNRYK
jgi:hypothetical protein